ncbi:MAG: hypothetical protein JWN03_6235 [Nocardia sp.]|nr:hypothetical protein [Nocardia sp.]
MCSLSDVNSVDNRAIKRGSMAVFMSAMLATGSFIRMSRNTRFEPGSYLFSGRSFILISDNLEKDIVWR